MRGQLPVTPFGVLQPVEGGLLQAQLLLQAVVEFDACLRIAQASGAQALYEGRARLPELLQASLAVLDCLPGLGKALRGGK